LLGQDDGRPLGLLGCAPRGHFRGFPFSPRGKFASTSSLYDTRGLPVIERINRVLYASDPWYQRALASQ
jgi:hypothetical protein